MRVFLFLLLSFCFLACSKQVCKEERKADGIESATTARRSKPATSTFTKYTIQKGNHECDQRTVTSVSGTSMNFTARFDSSAIYPAVITDYNHAYDVNKLYGFSEGLNNQYNSARIGWRWLDGQLQLLAYVYVNGKLLRDPITYDPPFIKTVAIGAEINCSIAVSGTSYVFTVDGVVVTTPRGTSAGKYQGYRQYPYFGGTLTAPHLITIYIK